MMNEEALLSIKQFSKFTGVSQRTLRYYDEVGLLCAASRGGDNNYRLYTLSQRTALNFIGALVDLGIPLSEIKAIIEQRTPENIIGLLAQQEINLDEKLNELRTAYSIIHTFRRSIQAGLLGGADQIRLEVLEETRFILGPVNEFKDGEDIFEDPYIKFCNAARDYRINLRYPIGRYYYDMESFLSKPGRPDKFFSMDPIGNCVRELGQYLVGYKDGAENDLAPLPQKMAAYAMEHGLVLDGPVYGAYLLNEICMNDPGQYRMRLSVHVAGQKGRSKREWKQNAERCPQRLLCVRPHCAAL